MESDAMTFLPSATVVAERLCFHRCLSSTVGKCTPPWQPDPPGRQTPSWADTPWQADTPPLKADPLPTGRTPSPKMATTADGTHPTGMHSCKKLYVHMKCVTDKIPGKNRGNMVDSTILFSF